VSTIATPTNPKVLFQDDFSNPNSGWQRFSDETRDTSYENAEYSFTVKKTNWSYWCMNRNAGVFKDLIIEVDARLYSGASQTSYGLVFQAQDNNSFYAFTLSGEGNCSLSKRVNGSWTVLQSWPKLAYANPGNTVNRLKIVRKGAQMDAYVNGNILAEVTDSSFSQGNIGVLVNTKEAPACARFDELKVYNPD
jgi:hypothetical protein